MQTREGWKRRAWKGEALGRERPTLRVRSEGKVAPVLCAGRPESRGSSGRRRRWRWRRRRRRGGAEGGSRVRPGRRSGSRPVAQLRPARPGPRLAASVARRPAQRGLVPAPKLSLGKASGRLAARTQAPPGWRGGTRGHAAPLRRDPGPARRRPPVPKGRCPGRGPGPRPASLPRPDPKG